MENCIRGVMLGQLVDLGLSPSPRDLDLNRYIGGLNLATSVELLDEVEAWLLKLADANRKSGRYNIGAFERALAHEWFEVCKFMTPLGFHTWKKYRSSPLSHFAAPAIRRMLKFALKCALRHGRSGGDKPEF
jgi:hypothetical protein